MVAGAAGIDLVLLVIAADEGLMPQTLEHLAVIEQLGIPAGIPVLTKIDLVEPEWLALLEDEVTGRLRRSPVPFSAPVRTSVRSGAGLAALCSAIEDRLAEVGPRRDPADLARLPVDRAFSLPGAGTVVTGTAWSGSLRVADEVRLLPGEEIGRIRSLESHGKGIEVSRPGERLAVAIVGIERERVRRGQVLVSAGDSWAPTRVIDAELELLEGAPQRLTHQQRVRLHAGTLEVLARVQLRAPIERGARGLARLVLEEPAVVRGGDRLVLRSYSPVQVIGGGRVLDPVPPPGRVQWPAGINGTEAPERLAALLHRRPQGIERIQVPQLLGVTPAAAGEVIAGAPIRSVDGRLVLLERVAEAAALVGPLVRSYHVQHRTEAGLPLETLRQALGRFGPAADAAIAALAGTGLVIDGGVVREGAFRPSVAGGTALVDRLVTMLDEAGLAPPSVGELETALPAAAVAEALRLAARTGRIVALERDRYFHPSALARFRDALSGVAAAGAITPAAIREVLGVSRKFLIPLLEWSDREGLTVRRGEARVAGPALAKARPV
jgi:selenocysteine-specific elongation factor